jgi:hypothetical protein
MGCGVGLVFNPRRFGRDHQILPAKKQKVIFGFRQLADDRLS